MRYICEFCGNEFHTNRKKAFTCGDKKCVGKSNYQRHKESYIARVRKWEKDNPEKTRINRKESLDKFRKNKPKRFNELMMNGYHRNKEKWHCRSTTGNIVNGRGYRKYEIPLKMCACGSKENLEIHHEIYPKGVKNIRQAIDDKKIYYKCRKCHGRRKSHKIK